MADTDINLWDSPEHALGYLARADSIPRRVEGERTVLEFLPPAVARVLDLGSGDGRLLALVRHVRPEAEAVALDFSNTMLERSRVRFAGDALVTIVAHDMNVPLPDSLGTFDAVVSSFAIHHLAHERKRSLYAEVYRLLRPGGVFLNLEHVASPTDVLHLQFLEILDVAPGDEDPSNKLLDVETQLSWLRAIGFADVDCHWKWRELALLGGKRPATPAAAPSDREALAGAGDRESRSGRTSIVNGSQETRRKGAYWMSPFLLHSCLEAAAVADSES